MGENASNRNKMPLILFILLLAAVVALAGRALIALDPFLRYARIVVITVLEVVPWLILSALLGEIAAVLVRRWGAASPWVADVWSWYSAGYAEKRPPVLATPAPALYAGLAVITPMLNPVVLVSTALAFPDNPGVFWGRLLGTILTALVVTVGSKKSVSWRQRAKDHERWSMESGDKTDFRPSSHDDAALPASFSDRVFVIVLRNLGPVVVATLAVALLRVIDGGPLAAIRGSTTPWVPVVTALGLFVAGYLLAVPAVGDAVVVRLLLPWIPAPLLVAFLVTGPVVNIRHQEFHPAVLSIAAVGSIGTAVVLGRLW